MEINNVQVEEKMVQIENHLISLKPLLEVLRNATEAHFRSGLVTDKAFNEWNYNRAKDNALMQLSIMADAVKEL